MNHPFTLSWLNPNLCAKCNRDKLAHGNEAICEACNNVGTCEIFGKILLCSTCLANEINVVKKISDEDSEVNLLKYKSNEQLTNLTKETKNLIEVREQYYNARVSSIIEIEKSVNEDDSIPQDKKRYEVSKRVNEHVQMMKRALFEHNEAGIKLTNELRADIVYLNQKASELSSKEREELKIKDINYQPNSKPVSNIKIPTVKLSKTDKIIENYAKLMKIPIEQARHLIARNIESAAKK